MGNNSNQSMGKLDGLFEIPVAQKCLCPQNGDSSRPSINGDRAFEYSEQFEGYRPYKFTQQFTLSKQTP